MTLSSRVNWNDASFGALVAAFPNTGFMGIPLLVALLGPRAAGPAIVTIVIDLVITTSLCIALSRLGSGGGSAGQAAKNALKGVASNPMPWAIMTGALASWLGFELPAPLMKTVGLLADSASPVALFTIGAVLARSQMMALSGHAPAVPLREIVPVALMKLVLHPVLVLLVGSAAIALGLPLDRFALAVIVLVAALPSASNVSLLAERFEANTGRIARIILVSTVLAFFSFAAAVKLVAP
jgi:malonate transporter and related proteins